MHFRPSRCHYGFEQMELEADYYRHMAKQGINVGRHGLALNQIAPGRSSVPHAESATQWVVDRSIDFIETRDPTRPFFLWTSFEEPHPPFNPCQEFADLYRDIDLPDPVLGDWSQQVDDMSAALRTTTVALSDYSRLSTSQQTEARRSYYALISQVDAALGRLFARLHDMGLLANTWIIFTSDHGEMLGDHHLGSKLIHFEGSAHIPMVIRPPTGHPLHQQKGTTCDRLVSLADILPTCLDMAAVTSETPLDGQSMLTIHAEHAANRLHIGNCSDTYFMVMQDHWKYHWFANGGDELLFNIAEDPYEQHNVLHHQAAQEHVPTITSRTHCAPSATSTAIVRPGSSITTTLTA